MVKFIVIGTNIKKPDGEMVMMNVFGDEEIKAEIILDVITTQDPEENGFNYIRDHYVPDLSADLFEDGPMNKYTDLIIPYDLEHPLPAPGNYDDVGVDMGDLIHKIVILRLPDEETSVDAVVGGRRRRGRGGRKTRRRRGRCGRKMTRRRN